MLVTQLTVGYVDPNYSLLRVFWHKRRVLWWALGSASANSGEKTCDSKTSFRATAVFLDACHFAWQDFLWFLSCHAVPVRRREYGARQPNHLSQVSVMIPVPNLFGQQKVVMSLCDSQTLIRDNTIFENWTGSLILVTSPRSLSYPQLLRDAAIFCYADFFIAKMWFRTWNSWAIGVQNSKNCLRNKFSKIDSSNAVCVTREGNIQTLSRRH